MKCKLVITNKKPAGAGFYIYNCAVLISLIFRLVKGVRTLLINTVQPLQVAGSTIDNILLV